MVKKIAAIVALAVGVPAIALLGFSATKSDTFRVERSTTVQVAPEQVHALVNDFNNWGAWSPWEKLDPAMKKTLSGAASGKGAVYEWEGNDQVGKGRMEIVESAPPSKVVIKLDFLQPFEAHNTTEFTFAAEGDATKVTWAMHGRNNFLSKVMSVFMNMDQMIGADFERGLGDMKAVAEKK